MMKIDTMGPLHSDGLSILEKNDYDVFEVTDFSSESLIAKLQDVDGIALRTAKLTKDVLEKCQKLKIVSRHGVGYDNVDLNYLNEKKIALAITGTSNAVTVAEHVMAMFLNVCKIIKQSDKLVRDGKFSEKDYYQIFLSCMKRIFLFLALEELAERWLNAALVLIPRCMCMTLLLMLPSLKKIIAYLQTLKKVCA